MDECGTESLHRAFASAPSPPAPCESRIWWSQEKKVARHGLMADLFLEPTTSFKSKLQSAVQRLAASNILIGTSSWKYEGWRGLIYDEQRYHYRGKFAETRFERDCLVEYAEVFKTVCVDAAYYQFPSEKYLTGLVSKVPGDFLFTFKVTDDITLKRFTNLPRFGIKAGKPNENFLNADLFINAFLKPCEPFLFAPRHGAGGTAVGWTDTSRCRPHRSYFHRCELAIEISFCAANSCVLAERAAKSV